MWTVAAKTAGTTTTVSAWRSLRRPLLVLTTYKEQVGPTLPKSDPHFGKMRSRVFNAGRIGAGSRRVWWIDWNRNSYSSYWYFLADLTLLVNESTTGVTHTCSWAGMKRVIEKSAKSLEGGFSLIVADEIALIHVHPEKTDRFISEASREFAAKQAPNSAANTQKSTRWEVGTDGCGQYNYCPVTRINKKDAHHEPGQSFLFEPRHNQKNTVIRKNVNSCSDLTHVPRSLVSISYCPV